jgi:hypothetical protein
MPLFMLGFQACLQHFEKNAPSFLLRWRLGKKSHKALSSAIAKTDAEPRSFAFFAKLKALNLVPSPSIGPQEGTGLNPVFFEDHPAKRDADCRNCTNRAYKGWKYSDESTQFNGTNHN